MIKKEAFVFSLIELEPPLFDSLPPYQASAYLFPFFRRMLTFFPLSGECLPLSPFQASAYLFFRRMLTDFICKIHWVSLLFPLIKEEAFTFSLGSERFIGIST